MKRVARVTTTVVLLAAFVAVCALILSACASSPADTIFPSLTTEPARPVVARLASAMPTTTVQTTAKPTAVRTTAKPIPVRTVTPGAYCTTIGVTGVSKTGATYTCRQLAGETRARWRR